MTKKCLTNIPQIETNVQNDRVQKKKSYCQAYTPPLNSF